MRTIKNLCLMITVVAILTGCSSLGPTTPSGGDPIHILPALTPLKPDVSDVTTCLLGPRNQPYAIQFEVLDTAEVFNTRLLECSERPVNQNLAAYLTLTIRF